VSDSVLIEISGCRNPQRVGDVIFVHGLGGSARSTWHPQGKDNDDNFWPAWLGEDMLDVGIWSLGYEVEPLRWKSATMPLVDRATNTLALLDSYEIGERPLIFITYSLGGLLVKQMLRHAQDWGYLRWQAIVEQTKGIVFLSTPHSGSNLATWINYIGEILGTSVSVKELEDNHSRLRELNLLYRNEQQLSQIPMQVYCEMRKTSGMKVVSEISADPGIKGVIPIPIDGNHIAICKPESKGSLIYLRVKRFVKECLQVPLPNKQWNNKVSSPSTLPLQLGKYILHLSDLNITNSDEANLWSEQLAEDLYRELNIRQLDALILSGNIAKYSIPEEYQAAKQFLNNLRQDFSLEAEKIIMVPGNRDFNRGQSKQAYKLIDREDYKGELKEGHYIEETSTIIRVRDEDSYKQRFVNFSQFYQAITGQPYPQDYNEQGILYHLPEQKILILGLNSAWQLDQYYESRVSINAYALSNALKQIRRNQYYDNCLKIAVWHHPVVSADEDRITDSAFLDRLAVAGFRIFLHGHIHEAKTSNYHYDMSQNGRKLDQICAGTFGAPTKELVTATPWQYNLLQFEPDKLTVRTRRRSQANGVWEADSIWRQGKGESSLDYYEIEL